MFVVTVGQEDFAFPMRTRVEKCCPGDRIFRWQGEVVSESFGGGSFRFLTGQKWPMCRTGNVLSNRRSLDPLSGRSYYQGRKMPQLCRLTVQAGWK